MKNPFVTGPERFQPDPGYIYTTNVQMRVDQKKLAFIVGLIALGLPIEMLVGSAFGSCFYDSISHYYYAQFWGDVVVGSLVFVGTFLIVYRGANSAENVLATLAGLCAYGVAVLPTSGRGCADEEFSGRALVEFERLNDAMFVSVKPASESNSLFELFTNVETWHYVSAAALFAFLAYYSFFVFTRVIDDQRQQDRSLSLKKRARNRIYYASGSVILVSMAALGANGFIGFSGWNDFNLTFWCEAFALWAFGFSWMVKGRFSGFLLLDEQDRLDNETYKS
jgi:hypothetical protein